MVEHDAFADFSGFADDDSHSVVNKKATTNGGTGVNFNAGEESGELG